MKLPSSYLVGDCVVFWPSLLTVIRNDKVNGTILCYNPTTDRLVEFPYERFTRGYSCDV